MRYVLLALILASGVMPALAAESVPNEIQQLRWLDGADPIADAKAALDRKDFRLVGVNGYTWIMPGVPESLKFEYKKKYGMRILEGTSDNLLNKEHEWLDALAYNYAERYNEFLLVHLK